MVAVELFDHVSSDAQGIGAADLDRGFPGDLEVEVATDLFNFVPRDVDVTVALDLLQLVSGNDQVPVTADPFPTIVLDTNVNVLFTVKENLLTALSVFEADLVESTAPLGTQRFRSALRLLGGKG